MNYVSVLAVYGFHSDSGYHECRRCSKIYGTLGYPKYFTTFIGVAKILGSVAILIPDFKKIKEGLCRFIL
ncbi:MAG: DoxX family protein [Ferruginibacter sp.]